MEGLREEYVCCPLCQANDYSVVYTANLAADINLAPSQSHSQHGQFVQCRSCQMVYANPRINAGKLSDGYGEYVDDSYFAEETGRAKTARKVLQLVSKFKTGGRVLDIGCSCGIMLNEFKQAGFTCTGIELSSWACTTGQQKYGLNLINLPLEQAGLQPGSFDIVMLNDSIEHLLNPLAMLREVHQLLADDGLLYIFTPDCDSTMAKVMKESWWNVVQSHTVLFSKKTLRQLVENGGFEIICSSTHGRTFSLQYWIKQGQNLFPQLAHMLGRLLQGTWIGQLPITINFYDQVEFIARKQTPSSVPGMDN